MTTSIYFLICGLMTSVLTFDLVYKEEDINAYHFHTYFFESNPRHVKEALNFRVATKRQIENGFLDECSLNEIMIGIDGPHPYSQYELCCNKTSFSRAMAWHMQNHGNLSILIHPLTVHDFEDHFSRAAWIGQAVPLDMECPFLYPLLVTPRPCPVYPDYPDEIQPVNASNELQQESLHFYKYITKK